MNKNNNKMDLLGNAPVPQALMALGIPIMIGMLINALYNLVDAYFIGGLGESQMGAISIAFPLGQVVVGLGLMFGNGAASYLSRLLGRGDREAASKVASTALYSSVCIGAVIIIGTAIFLKPILTMLGATDTIMPFPQKYVLQTHAGKSASVLHPAAYEALSSVFHLTSYSILDISPVPPAIKAAPSFGSPAILRLQFLPPSVQYPPTVLLHQPSGFSSPDNHVVFHGQTVSDML